MDPSQLVLRDVHLPASPSLWPPAPGWWLVAAVVLAVCAFFAWRSWSRRRMHARWASWFDQQAHASTEAARVAAISELLRRAARRVDPNADRLQGDAWLEFLDGAKGAEFSRGPGRVLLDGAFRRDVDPDAVRRLQAIARPRFLQLMAGTR